MSAGEAMNPVHGWPWLASMLTALGVGGAITALIQKWRPRVDSAAVVVGAANKLVESTTTLAEGLTEELVRLKGDAAVFREQVVRLERDLDAALQRAADLTAENERLRADLERVRSERDLLRGERDQLKQVMASRAKLEERG